jgi:hypothetical protein
MKKFIRYFALTVVVVTALALVSAVSGIAIARAMLPKSACAVTESQVDTLVLEKMSYADVRSTLGCNGVLVKKEDYGPKLVIEDYGWQGDTWPYSKFEGHFINGVLHGTSKTWFNVAFSPNTP